MPYTLGMFVLWAVLAAVIGGLIGWSLHSVGRRRSTPTADAAETERLRRRVAELEAMIASSGRPASTGATSGSTTATGARTTQATANQASAREGSGREATAREASAREASAREGSAREGSAREGSAREASATAGSAGEGPAREGPTGSGVPSPEAGVDLDAAAEILGERIRLDDLTAVRGLSGSVAELCGGIGVTTWQALAATPVDDLHSMLDAAGEAVEVAHLETWPRQAALLAAGEWADFRALVDGLGPER